MRIEVIDTPQGLAGLEEDWERVFLADPEAQHFLSHRWIGRYFAGRRGWFVLALRPAGDAPLSAFFPLRLRTRRDGGGRFFDEIVMGGDCAADYTGFIAVPEWAEAAARGFAGWLAGQNWTQIRFDGFSAGAARTAALMQALEGPRIRFCRPPARTGQDFDNTICPHIVLPGSFDAYLEGLPSSRTRQKMRRFLRRLDGGDYRITRATPETLSRDLDILFGFWRARWTPVKGAEKCARLIGPARRMLEDCFADGDLDVPVLWSGDRPLGALANILDRRKKAVLFYITGRDETWKQPSPGLLLHADAIRRAITGGFATYDFLRGNEPYKYAFGVTERRISHILARREADGCSGLPLHPWSVRTVYETALGLCREGRKAEAETAFTQILQTEPRHCGAAFGLANLHFARQEFHRAETLYRALLQQVGDPLPVLARLGDLLIATRRFEAAAQAFGEICDRAPDDGEARFKQGVALLAGGERDKAAAAFSIAAGKKDEGGYATKAKAALARLIFESAPAPRAALFPPFDTPPDEAAPSLH